MSPAGRWTPATLHPRSRKASLTARPTPPVPPATKATLPPNFPAIPSPPCVALRCWCQILLEHTSRIPRLAAGLERINGTSKNGQKLDIPSLLDGQSIIRGPGGQCQTHSVTGYFVRIVA